MSSESLASNRKKLLSAEVTVTLSIVRRSANWVRTPRTGGPKSCGRVDDEVPEGDVREAVVRAVWTKSNICTPPWAFSMVKFVSVEPEDDLPPGNPRTRSGNRWCLPRCPEFHVRGCGPEATDRHFLSDGEGIAAVRGKMRVVAV